MQVRLDPAQTAEMADRASDVSKIVSILADHRRDATPESAFLSWSQHSDRSSASWLITDRNDDFVAAHDALVMDALAKRASAVLSSMGEEQIHEFVRDLLAAVSTDPEDPEVLTVRTLAPHDEQDVVLGTMRRYGSEDQTLVESIADRFDIELPSDFERSCRRSNLMTMLLMIIEDENDYAC